jgi:endonuclease/exonuclease/phosphatase family metal-dependent hydrolase
MCFVLREEPAASKLSDMRPFGLLVATGLLEALLFLAGCQSMTNYEQPDGPVFKGSSAPVAPVNDGSIKIVTWNIKYGDEIETAIRELSETIELADAEVLLLQEMHAPGVEAIAEALGHNYVYYPASIHTRHEKDFGNAVLSKWPILSSEKLMLPNANPRNGQRRIAVKGTLDVAGNAVDVYSVHTETLWMGPEGRAEQFERVTDATESERDRLGMAAVGGDFNTLTPQGRNDLTHRFADAGFQPALPDETPTFSVAGVGAQADHLFIRGMEIEASGVWPETEASDHYPAWTVVSLP